MQKLFFICARNPEHKLVGLILLFEWTRLAWNQYIWHHSSHLFSYPYKRHSSQRELLSLARLPQIFSTASTKLRSICLTCDLSTWGKASKQWFESKKVETMQTSDFMKSENRLFSFPKVYSHFHGETYWIVNWRTSRQFFDLKRNSRKLKCHQLKPVGDSLKLL
jgi:hypothetical protein